MKKVLALILTMIMAVSLFSCGTTNDANTTTNADKKTTVTAAAQSDWDYISNNGKMVIGITEYEPMNYYDKNGTLIGFDTEFAQAVCAKLGITPEFQVINWDMKETELKAKNIDCIWNGLTVTEERKANMDFTDSYLTNKQCVVINKADADKYTTTESLSKALLAAEKGSAGETAITTDKNLKKASLTKAETQAKALSELNLGNFDAIVVDYTMAKASVGNGDYDDLMIVDGIDLADELYAIGFRLGSDMTDKVNDIIAGLISDGTLKTFAEKYDVVDLYEASIAK